MKATTSCDEVFDALTAGPFPSGKPSDVTISEHLAACAECHHLAEALRPACDLLHESLPPYETHGLPMFLEGEARALQDNLRAVMQQIQLPEVHAELRPAQQPSPRRFSTWSQRILGGLCIALLLILLARAGMPWSGQKAGTWQPLENISFSPNCLVPATAGRSMLQNVKLAQEQVCCTGCHNTKLTTHRGPASAALLASCGNCH